MTLPIGLHLATLILCIITLSLATAALLPQLKLAVVILRDGLLWLALLGVVGAVGVIGWGRFFKAYAERQQQGAVVAEPPPVMIPSRSGGLGAPTAKATSLTRASLGAAPDPAAGRTPRPAFSANRSRPLE